MQVCSVVVSLDACVFSTKKVFINLSGPDKRYDCWISRLILSRARRPESSSAGCQPRQCQHSVGNAEDALAQQLAPVTFLLLAHASALPEARGLHGWRMHAQRRRAPVGRGGRARMQGRRARGQGVGLHVQVPQPRRRPAWRWWRHAHRQRQRSRQRRLRRGRVARGVGSAGGDHGARGLCR